MKPDDAYFDGEYPDPPPALFDNIDAFEEILIDEKEAASPDIDDLLPPPEDVVKKKTKKRKRKCKAVSKDRTPVLNEGFIPDGDLYDEYLNTQVMMSVGDCWLTYVVVNRTLDQQGVPTGKHDNNPVLDTRAYNMKLPDGSIEQYTANTIAECLYADIDDAGNTYALLNELIGHRKNDTALSKDEASYFHKSGQLRNKPTTKGWEIEVDWKDSTSSWCTLSDIKNSYPVQLADYAIKRSLEDEPVFVWWVRHVTRKRNSILKATKSNKYWLRTQKYGIEFPHCVAEAYAIDRRTGTIFWTDAIQKEMKNNGLAFEFNPKDIFSGSSYTKITTHIVFDVKLGTLTQKARLCADGHKVPALAKEHTYSSVPSRDSVRTFFLIAALNGLDVLSADIQNAYLTAPLTGKYYTIARESNRFPKEYDGRPWIILRSLYGLPIAGA